MQAIVESRLPRCRLSVANSGRQALAMAPLLPPTLLLLDIDQPDCSGVELLQRLRRRFGPPDLPAVAVSGDRDFVPEGSGFEEVWHKPLDVQRMQPRLDALLGVKATPAAVTKTAGRAVCSPVAAPRR
jgi:CheY-like chemotaxis protein